VREGVRDLRIGFEDGLDSLSEVGFAELSETKNKNGRGEEQMEDKNATTCVANN
jgi:hypothetical protein